MQIELYFFRVFVSLCYKTTLVRTLFWGVQIDDFALLDTSPNTSVFRY